jgi:hypothetical protein
MTFAYLLATPFLPQNVSLSWREIEILYLVLPTKVSPLLLAHWPLVKFMPIIFARGVIAPANYWEDLTFCSRVGRKVMKEVGQQKISTPRIQK